MGTSSEGSCHFVSSLTESPQQVTTETERPLESQKDKEEDSLESHSVMMTASL